MKTLNHNIKPYIKALLIILLLLIIYLLNSCNPAKQLQRKEDKSLGIVLGSQRVFPKAGAAWLAIHPCVITTTKSDTGKIIIKEVPVTLPPVKIPFPVYKWKQFSFDTLINGLSVYIDSNGIVISGEYICKEKTIPIKETQRDDTRVDNLTDSINQSKRENATQKGQILELQTNNSESKKEANKKNWYFIIASVIAAISVFFNVKSSVSKIPSLVSGIFKK